MAHNGQKWLADSLSESTNVFWSRPSVTWFIRIHRNTFRTLILRGLQRSIKFLETIRSRFQTDEMDEEIHVGVEAPSVTSMQSPELSRTFSLARQNTHTTHPSISISVIGTGSHQSHENNNYLSARPLTPIPASPLTPFSPGFISTPQLPSSLTRRRWQNAVLSCGM